MRPRPLSLQPGIQWQRLYRSSRKHSTSPLIHIANGTFYRRHPATTSDLTSDQHPLSSNPPLFPNLSLSIPSFASPSQHWAILSPSSSIRSAFLEILHGHHICLPPTSRSFPYLGSDECATAYPGRSSFPERAFAHVGFDAERKAFGGAYLSARYESRIETTDLSVEQYLTGIVGQNVDDQYVKENKPEREQMLQVVRDLELEHLFERPVSTLSNGQSRRARIGKALLTKPMLLLLDAPFIGLDPHVSKHISALLYRLSEANSPRVIVSLRPQDVIPSWITHIIYAGRDGKVSCIGPKQAVFDFLQDRYHQAIQVYRAHKAAEEMSNQKVVSGTAEIDPELAEIREVGHHLIEKGDISFQEHAVGDTPDSKRDLLSRDGYGFSYESDVVEGDPLVEMEGVRINYGTHSVLGGWKQDVAGETKDGLWWTVRRGQRWGIFGANGSGKTTLLSLITSDHPQTYSAPVRIFQRSRLPSLGAPGISIFDIQSRMGHSSPEVHSLFPKYLSVRRAVESAWADTPITRPRLDQDATKRVEACLRWFQAELNPGLGMTTLQRDERTRVEKGTHLAQGGTALQEIGQKHDQEADAQGLQWAKDMIFGELSFSGQRVVLFLRAIIRNPDIVILDEAFSGMDDIARDKCLLFLSRGEFMTLHYMAGKGTESGGPVIRQSEIARLDRVQMPGLQDRQALVTISHSRQEVPGCVRDWICLPESGTKPPRVGRLEGPVELSIERWNEIWGSSSV